jgi:Penicillin amidase
VIDQRYITSWNNKQAHGVAAPDTDSPYTSLFRNQPLDKRIKSRIRGKRTITRTGLVNAMGDAGTVDMRGAYVLPWLLRVLRARPAAASPPRRHGQRRWRRRPAPAFTGAARPGPLSDPVVRRAVGELSAWLAQGAHRRDSDGDGVYEHSDAIRIMDAWWPRLVRAEFGPTLGSGLLDELESSDPIDNTPNGGGSHLGSSWDVGFYGTVQKDLRLLLHRHERGPLSRTYCGGGSLVRCQRALASSLKAAVAVPASTLYRDDTCAKAGQNGSQTCFDSISYRPLGAITQPLETWINRPTFQQVVQVK